MDVSPEQLLEMDGTEEPDSKKHKHGWRIEHFKVKHDQTWNYKKIACDLFNGPKVMVQWDMGASQCGNDRPSI
jgi:hypothetical protein